MPLFTVDQAVARKDMVNDFINKVLKEDVDYGKMPGGRDTKVLLKPGAEKLCSIFGFATRYVDDLVIEDWIGADHGGEPLFYYRYRCQLYRGDRFMGEAIGSANSWEAKHRYRWVTEDQLPGELEWDNQDRPWLGTVRLLSRGGKRTLFEFDFSLEKRESSGKYGHPAEYWDAFDEAIRKGSARRAEKDTKNGKRKGWEMDVDQTLFRIPNPDSADVVNTCQKMAQKRALVAAVLVVTNCSDAFTQDLEDVETPEQVLERRLHETAAAPDAAPPAEAEGEPVPAGLVSFFANMDKDGWIRQGLEAMKAKLEKAMPTNGEAEYRRLVAKHDLKAGASKEQVRAAMIDMWNVATFAEQHSPVTAEEAYNEVKR